MILNFITVKKISANDVSLKSVVSSNVNKKRAFKKCSSVLLG